jgi:hypothetical protein
MVFPPTRAQYGLSIVMIATATPVVINIPNTNGIKI